MSPDAHSRLVELDALSRQAREFYEYAAAVLPASALRDRCLGLARTKAELVALLAQRLQGGRDSRLVGTPAPRLLESVGAIYARARTHVTAPDTARLSDALHRVEATVTQACEAQASGSSDADCRQAMAWVLPVLRRCLDQARGGGPAPSLH